MDWAVVGGLVGITLVVSVSGIFGSLRDWLLGFSVASNPLRIVGTLLDSTLAVGFCVGLAWSFFGRHGEPVLVGGLVSLAAAVADEALALAHGIVRRVLPMRLPMPQPQAVGSSVEKKKGPLTEEDAHAEMDRKEAEGL